MDQESQGKPVRATSPLPHAFDKRMLKLQLRPKPNAIAKSVSEEQDEPVKVERRRVQAVVIQVGSPCNRHKARSGSRQQRQQLAPKWSSDERRFLNRLSRWFDLRNIGRLQLLQFASQGCAASLSSFAAWFNGDALKPSAAATPGFVQPR
jgi:hypothetical protein